MAAIAAQDLRRFTVPDSLNLAAALAGFAGVWLEAGSAGLDPTLQVALAGLNMLLCGGALFILREAFFRLRGVDGLGLGDVKLAATAGIWLGWERFALALLIAAAAALIVVALRRWREGDWPRERRIPLALYLAPAVWAVWALSRLGAPPG